MIHRLQTPTKWDQSWVIRFTIDLPTLWPWTGYGKPVQEFEVGHTATSRRIKIKDFLSLRRFFNGKRWLWKKIRWKACRLTLDPWSCPCQRPVQRRSARWWRAERSSRQSGRHPSWLGVESRWSTPERWLRRSSPSCQGSSLWKDEKETTLMPSVKNSKKFPKFSSFFCFVFFPNSNHCWTKKTKEKCQMSHRLQPPTKTKHQSRVIRFEFWFTNNLALKWLWETSPGIWCWDDFKLPFEKNYTMQNHFWYSYRQSPSFSSTRTLQFDSESTFCPGLPPKHHHSWLWRSYTTRASCEQTPDI